MLYQRNGHIYDVYSETGEEGMEPGAWLPADADDGSNGRTLSMAEAEAVVLDAVSHDPTADRIRWPRHFWGPSTATAIVNARMRLTDRDIIAFDNDTHYWKLAIQA